MRIQITLITRSVNTLLCSRLINRSITRSQLQTLSRWARTIPIAHCGRWTDYDLSHFNQFKMFKKKKNKRYKSEEIMNVLLSLGSTVGQAHSQWQACNNNNNSSRSSSSNNNKNSLDAARYPTRTSFVFHFSARLSGFPLFARLWIRKFTRATLSLDALLSGGTAATASAMNADRVLCLNSHKLCCLISFAFFWLARRWQSDDYDD